MLFDSTYGSVGKESACSAGDPDSIPWLERSLGEGNGSPLQYSCLGKPMDRGAWQTTVHGVARVGHDLATKPSPPYKVPGIVKFIESTSVDARGWGKGLGVENWVGGGWQ